MPFAGSDFLFFFSAEKKEGSEESVATEAPKAPEPKPEPAPEPTVAKEEEGESQV